MGSVDSTSSIELPIFDVSDQSLENSKRMLQAAIDYGFLYISPSGTNFTNDLVDAQFELSNEFFAQPTSEKQAYNVGTDNRGWLGMHNEILDPAKQSREFKEAFNIGEFDKDGMPQQRMPPCLSNNKALSQLRHFESACRQACAAVLDLIGEGLQIQDEKDWFSRRHGQPSGCTVRLLHYPALPEGTEYSLETDVRAGAHSDYGSITLLFQRHGQPGLEIRPLDNSNVWSPVPVCPPGWPSSSMPPILVNIGDLTSYWSNGLLRSTVHRVIFPKDTKAGEARKSIAYFCHPSDDCPLIAVPSRLVEEHKDKSAGHHANGTDNAPVHGYGGGMTHEQSMTAREHLMKRLGATYNHREERSRP